MRDQIVSVYMPNFSSNACDGELIGSLFPSNLSGKEKKAFANAKKAGFDLKCRFPVYPEFFSFISKKLRDKIAVIENEEGYVKEEYWK